MEEFSRDDRVLHEEFGMGTVTEVAHYPDGDFRYYVVNFDCGVTMEMGTFEGLELYTGE